MAKKKQDLSLVVWVFGWLLALATALKKFAATLDVPFEAFERLGSNQGEATIGKIVQLIHSDWLDAQPKPRVQTGSPYRGGVPNSDALPPVTYRLHVSYAKLLGVKALEPKFSGKGSVSVLYDGREWARHKSCAKIDETPGERDFLVAEIPAEFLGKRIDTSEDALAEYYDRLGYRFAIETEAVEFAAAQPELQRKNWIYALGSSALGVDGDRYVSMLSASGRDRVLSGHWVVYGLRGDDRLLLVRKAS